MCDPWIAIDVCPKLSGGGRLPVTASRLLIPHTRLRGSGGCRGVEVRADFCGVGRGILYAFDVRFLGRIRFGLINANVLVGMSLFAGHYYYCVRYSVGYSTFLGAYQ